MEDDYSNRLENKILFIIYNPASKYSQKCLLVITVTHLVVILLSLCMSRCGYKLKRTDDNPTILTGD